MWLNTDCGLRLYVVKMMKLISKLSLLSGVVLLCSFCLACSESGDDAGTPSMADAGVDMALDAEVSLDQSPAPDVAIEDPVDDQLPTQAAAAASPRRLLDAIPTAWDVLSDGSLVYSDGQQFWMQTADETISLGFAEGDLKSAALVDNEIVLLTTTGLFVAATNQLDASPLIDALGQIQEIMSDQKGGLWLLDEDGVSHWRRGDLRRQTISDSDLSFQDARAAIGRYQNEDVLWLSDGRTLLGVGETQTWHFQWETTLDWITTTTAGLWVATGSELQLVGPEGNITAWSKPVQASSGLGSPNSDNLWLSSGFALYQWDGDALRERPQAPVHSVLRTDTSGALYLGTANGIEKVLGQRFVIIDGLASDDRLTTQRAVTIAPSETDAVDAVKATLNETVELAIDATEGWLIELDPMQVGPGQHRLTIEIQYMDGLALEQTIEFWGPPTWTADIEPISQTYCIGCHGDGGSAHRMVSRDTWVAEITWIIDDIETGRMPYGLPRLSDELIELVRGWQESDFLE
ncbi:MAG: cytochrome c [Myxococcota bacterium]|nr:cytochrome c [Myxococcota bacterium]